MLTARVAIVALGSILCAGCQTVAPVLPDCPRPTAYWQADDPLEPTPEYRAAARRVRAIEPGLAARLHELERYCYAASVASQ